MNNSFGHVFRLTSFGESHGKAIGGVIDGCPAGLEIDEAFIQNELNRRRPGQSKLTTPRDEKDKVELLSGIFEGKTTGTPIGFVVYNQDQKSKDYGDIKKVYRPSHADYTYDQKYGFRDYRGGGRSSARETIARVVAGAIAKLWLQELGITIHGYTSQIHTIAVDKPYTELDFSEIEKNLVRCPDPTVAKKMEEVIQQTQKEGDSLGGTISCVLKNVPVGLGEPVFDKLQADLGKAMLSINAVKGFEFGSGFSATQMKGSEHNDEFVLDNKKVTTTSNLSGGIQGGISNGENIYFSVAFKPTATIFKEQKSVDNTPTETTIRPKGRHDACVLPRAVPIVEAMAAMVIADHLLLSRLNKI